MATIKRALSIRQPSAEAIMRGVKRIEYRSSPTKVRGRIYIYASRGRYPAAEEAEMMTKYKIKDVPCDELPRGVLVGTAELWKCARGKRWFKWYLRKPERAKRLRKPTKKPQPKWFYPF